MKITLGWHIGEDNWAYENLSKPIIESLPEFNHVINQLGDVNILFCHAQFLQLGANSKTVFQIGGNRWYEVKRAEPSFSSG